MANVTVIQYGMPVELYRLDLERAGHQVRVVDSRQMGRDVFGGDITNLFGGINPDVVVLATASHMADRQQLYGRFREKQIPTVVVDMIIMGEPVQVGDGDHYINSFAEMDNIHELLPAAVSASLKR